ncbi:hypothetical protein EZV62_026414 [Acer yangbiense]|uniref:Gnk2-homologous domain-containing protein n=1 Tax=Acer yangbiense TaxID=1000413 RepID=A0A5C7GRG5_9ROSI|nr:hypothetical protein EZV62_026414 [Acer yangbiense]
MNFLYHLLALPDFFYHLCLSGNGNYTTNSTYQANLNSLLSSISSNSEISYGFYNLSAGQGSNKVNAIALCREDINLDVCYSCVNDSISKLTQLCPYRKEAIGWYDTCMLRYSNRDIFHIMDAETSLRYYLCNPNNVSSLDQFNQVLENLLDGLRSNAASGGSLGKFAVGYASAPAFKTLYALVQCTPDLFEQECNDCLVSITRVKSDIFSFGVLVLELVSGQKRSYIDTEEEIKCLLTQAWKKWDEGTASNLIDPTLKEGSRNEMMNCIHIGLLCVQESISDRPTIASVIHMLNSNSVTRPSPAKPGFFMQSSVILKASSSSLEPNSTSSIESDQCRIATAPL